MINRLNVFIKLLIPAVLFFISISGSAFAYIEKYPPYKFKDGPFDYLQAEPIVNGDKPEFTSEDGKVSVSLTKTEDGLELVIIENNYLIVKEHHEDFPLPNAVYMVDLDGNKLEDFIVIYHNGEKKGDITEEKAEIFLKRVDGYFQKISYESMMASMGDFVDLDKDGIYEIIITGMYENKSRKYFHYNIYEIKNFRLLNADDKFEGFPKYVRKTFRSNDKHSEDIAEEEGHSITSEKESSIRYVQLKSKKRISSEGNTIRDDAIPAPEEKNGRNTEKVDNSTEPLPVQVAGDKESPEVVTLHDRLSAVLEAIETRDKELTSKLELKEQEIRKAFEKKYEELESQLAAIKREIQEGEKTAPSTSQGEVIFKVGVVDIQRVIEESKKGKEAKTYFEGLISLRSDEELVRTEQELLGQIVQDIRLVVREYAKKEKFAYIAEKFDGGVIFSDDKFDITDEIIKLYDKKVEIQKQ